MSKNKDNISAVERLKYWQEIIKAAQVVSRLAPRPIYIVPGDSYNAEEKQQKTHGED